MGNYYQQGVPSDSLVLRVPNSVKAPGVPLINEYYKDMDAWTTGDLASYDPSTHYYAPVTSQALPCYLVNHAALEYVSLVDTRQNINAMTRYSYTEGFALIEAENITDRYVVVYGHANGKGGNGGRDSWSHAGCGGGSGYPSIVKVIIPPYGKVNFRATGTVTRDMRIEHASVEGTVVVYSDGNAVRVPTDPEVSGPIVAAAPGGNGSGNTRGSGYRSGGYNEWNGVPVAVWANRVDGVGNQYACLGGKTTGGHGTGGGASIVHSQSSTAYTGGAGAVASYYKVNVIHGEPGAYGGGGGGNSWKTGYEGRAGAGGPATMHIYVMPGEVTLTTLETT